jgi:hypothetical protein
MRAAKIARKSKKCKSGAACKINEFLKRRASLSKTFSAAVAGSLLAAAPFWGVQARDSSSQPAKVTADPNQRVCEDVVVTGSRLAKKRVCGTKAEWEAIKKADRDVVEDAQRHAADPCHAILTHTGAATC